METKTYNVYKFKELSKDAQTKAIDSLRFINTEGDDWQNFILDDWRTKLDGLGYLDNKIMFSGFGSQGDGACFEANVDIKAWLKAHKSLTKYPLVKKHIDDIKITIEHNYRYYFSTSTNVHYDIEMGLETSEDWDKIDDQCAQLCEAISEDRRDIGNAIYKELEKYYDEITRDNAIIESIEMNEYDFLDNGTLD